MQCAIYKSLRKTDYYLYIRQVEVFDMVPESLLAMLGELELVMELTLSSQRGLARVDVALVMAQLEEKGFYVQLPPTLEVA